MATLRHDLFECIDMRGFACQYQINFQCRDGQLIEQGQNAGQMIVTVHCSQGEQQPSDTSI
ncbi:hypothetical protein AW872_04945 [Aeromonas hydrophila]|nr:hypothetical protein AW872_04945 [Aeromonas hydrophila]KYQ14592.1 hypothetical protein AW873_04950 [Aeromonas hydrophila]KYQ16982.1 hypothetical protein AW875_04950 [Aeromonas hydrophila]KYQ21887.1 hypothetical protein AW874_01110 [Aeromonas hydrophila]MBD5794118.1 hypothetical protein [Aeromonas hydrophila]